MSTGPSEPIYAEISSNDLSVVLGVVSALMDRIGTATAEIGSRNGLYRVAVAEAAPEPRP